MTSETPKKVYNYLACMLCLDEVDQKSRLGIYTYKGKEKDIPLKIWQVTGIPVDEEICAIEILCTKCYRSIEKVVLFQENCRSNHAKKASGRINKKDCTQRIRKMRVS